MQRDGQRIDIEADLLKEIKICHNDLAGLQYTESVFEDVNLSEVTLYVPEGTKGTYELLYPWKDFGTIAEYVDQNDEHQYNAYSTTVIINDDSESAASRAHYAASEKQSKVVDYTPSGVAFEMPEAPVVSGYVFNGWVTAAPDVMPGNNVVLVASYTPEFAAGDVNGDHQVGIADIAAITNIMAGQ